MGSRDDQKGRYRPFGKYVLSSGSLSFWRPASSSLTGADVKFSRASKKDPAQITISDQTRPKVTILYRTLPRYSAQNPYQHTTKDHPGAKVVPQDRLLRPDLRLSRSDMGVRKVAEVARWFAQFIGGDGPA